MSKHRDEKHYLSDILESIEAIEIYLENISYEEFINDRKTCSATIRELEEKRLEKKIPLDELIRLVSDFLGIEKSEVFPRSRRRIIGKARALIAYYSIYEMPAP